LPSLAEVPAEQVTARLFELRVEERQRLVEFLLYLGELERRKLHLDLGFGSVFVYCTDYLGLSKGGAFRRTQAARLLQRFPVVAEYLADGRLNLTTLVELRDILTEERLDEILTRAAGLTEEQVRILVAVLQPRPEPSDLLRRLPFRMTNQVANASPFDTEPVAASFGDPADDRASASSGPNQSAPDVSQATDPATNVNAGATDESGVKSVVSRLRPSVELEAIAGSRYVLRAAVGQSFVEDLWVARSLLSHHIPDGDLEEVLSECMRIAVAVLSKRRRGSGKRVKKAAADTTAVASAASPLPPDAPRSRYIPAEVRKAVWERDAGRCAFTATTGRRCESTWKLEFHHKIPFARGGPTSVEHIELRCRAHNLRAAEQDFGTEHVARRVAASRGRTGKGRSGDGQPGEGRMGRGRTRSGRTGDEGQTGEPVRDG